jgi:hypothetical protein
LFGLLCAWREVLILRQQFGTKAPLNANSVVAPLFIRYWWLAQMIEKRMICLLMPVLILMLNDSDLRIMSLSL